MGIEGVSHLMMTYLQLERLKSENLIKNCLDATLHTEIFVKVHLQRGHVFVTGELNAIS